MPLASCSSTCTYSAATVSVGTTRRASKPYSVCFCVLPSVWSLRGPLGSARAQLHRDPFQVQLVTEPPRRDRDAGEAARRALQRLDERPVVGGGDVDADRRRRRDDLHAVERLDPDGLPGRVARDQRWRDADPEVRLVLEVLDAEHRVELADADRQLRVLERRDAAERLFQQQPGVVAGGLTGPDDRPVQSRHQLKAGEDHDRQLGGAVAEIDAGGIEEERRLAPDAGAPGQEPVHDRTRRRDRWTRRRRAS